MIEKINDRISILFTEEGFSKSNSVLIDDDTRIMIDSGAGKITDEARPHEIEMLLNSHCHIDHVCNTDLFINAKILAHPLERENFKSLKKIGGIENWEKYMDENPVKHLHFLGEMKPSLFGEWRIDGTIDEGSVIDAGKTKIEVLHTPGHTSGHLSFFFREVGLIFCGDICLTKVGPWYGDGTTSLDDFIASIKRIIEIKPDMVVSAHNKAVLKSGIKETLEEYGGRILKREESVYKTLKKSPCTLDELTVKKIIYPAHPSIFVYYWEKAMLVKHLTRLINSGLVEETDSGEYIAK